MTDENQIKAYLTWCIELRFLKGEIFLSDYVGTKVIAELWGCSPSQVTKWCREGAIEGAEQDRKGSPWRIPIDALKPEKKKERGTT